MNEGTEVAGVTEGTEARGTVGLTVATDGEVREVLVAVRWRARLRRMLYESRVPCNESMRVEQRKILYLLKTIKI